MISLNKRTDMNTEVLVAEIRDGLAPLTGPQLVAMREQIEKHGLGALEYWNGRCGCFYGTLAAVQTCGLTVNEIALFGQELAQTGRRLHRELEYGLTRHHGQVTGLILDGIETALAERMAALELVPVLR